MTSGAPPPVVSKATSCATIAALAGARASAGPTTSSAVPGDQRERQVARSHVIPSIIDAA
jgi:hypothetical protein